LDSYKYHQRARFPRVSHRSLDWHPNDHLGRRWFRPHLFEHRRQILRDCAESDANAYADSNSHSHCNSKSHVYAYGYRDGNGNSNAHGDCNRNANSYGYRNANTYTDADPVQWEMFTHAEAASDAGWATHSAPRLTPPPSASPSVTPASRPTPPARP
jgi:hypothetical protein